MSSSLQLHDYRLASLPSYGKWFVGLFATLMLCVCLWAGWLYTIEKGSLAESDNLPAVEQSLDAANGEDEDSLAVDDTEAVTAPEWDSAHAGKEQPLDNTGAAQLREEAARNQREERKLLTLGHLRHNLGLAHTHINGQTLLFFALGLLFLFTSVPSRIKTIAYVVFGLAVIVHNIGLSGWGFAQAFDDMLAVSGVIILIVIAYMSLMVFVELLKEPARG